MTYIMSLGLACNLCGECVESCPTEALAIADDKLNHDSEKCQYCEVCIDVCDECAIRIDEGEL